jgi:hypothetical protein
LLISLDFRPEIGGNGYYKNNYGSDVPDINSNIKHICQKTPLEIVAFFILI